MGTLVGVQGGLAVERRLKESVSKRGQRAVCPPPSLLRMVARQLSARPSGFRSPLVRRQDETASRSSEMNKLVVDARRATRFRW